MHAKLLEERIRAQVEVEMSVSAEQRLRAKHLRDVEEEAARDKVDLARAKLARLT